MVPLNPIHAEEQSLEHARTLWLVRDYVERGSGLSRSLLPHPLCVARGSVGVREEEPGQLAKPA